MNVVTLREGGADANQIEALTPLLRVAMAMTSAEAAFVAVMLPASPRLIAYCGFEPDQQWAAIQLLQSIKNERVVQGVTDSPWQSSVLIRLASPAGIHDPVLVLIHATQRLKPEWAAAPEMQDIVQVMASILNSQRIAERRVVENRVVTMVNDLVEPLGSAPSHRAAFTILTETICDRFRSAVCNIWRRTDGGSELRLVAGTQRGACDTPAFRDALSALVHLDGARVGDAILTGRQIITHDFRQTGGGHGYHSAPGPDHGLKALICTPFSSEDTHLALVVGFDTLNRDLEGIGEDILRLRPLVNMILRRRHRETKVDLLSRVVEASRDAVLMTRASPDGRADLPIVYANSAFEALTGYRVAEAIGRTPRMLQCEDTSVSERQRIAAAIHRREAVQAELLNQAQDGRRYWVDLQISPVFDTEGECKHFVAVQRDCTAERESRVGAERRERAFKELFEECPVPMFFLHPDTMMLMAANGAAERLFGFSAEEFRAMTALDMIEPSEHPALEQNWASMLANGGGSRRIWRLRTATGFNLRAEAVSRRMHVQGQPAVLTVIWDRTAQFAAEVAMHESDQKLRHLTNNLLQAQRMAQLGTWKWYPETGRVKCSDDMATMLGKPAVAISMTEEEFLAPIHHEDRPEMIESFNRLRAGMSVFDIAFRVTPDDGTERFLLFSGHSDEDNETTGSSGFCQDVTQRKLAEARLLRAEKLRSLGQLTGGITHDFNNLLTVISANLELALDDIPAGTPVAKLLTNAMRATDTGAKLNSHLLSFARRQPLRAASVAVKPFLAGLAELAQHTLGSGCTIVLEEPTTAVHVCADAAHLETALINLCLNARDAMPQGGTIHISHRAVELNRQTPRRWRDADKVLTGDPLSPAGLEDMAPGAYGCICVTDTGTGMTKDVKTRIFEPFFTTKAPSGGSGLGLSMVVGFAKQSGGGLTFETTPGRGTSFRMYLPLALASAEEPPVRPERQEPMQGRVLLVDDERSLHESITLMLRSLGLEVDAVASAEEAMARLKPPLRYDVLFSDVALGAKPDGIALCEAARSAWPELAILLSSGFFEQELRANTLSQLRAEFLAKPYRRQALRVALEGALLNRRIPASSEAAEQS